MSYLINPIVSRILTYVSGIRRKGQLNIYPFIICTILVSNLSPILNKNPHDIKSFNSSSESEKAITSVFDLKNSTNATNINERSVINRTPGTKGIRHEQEAILPAEQSKKPSYGSLMFIENQGQFNSKILYELQYENNIIHFTSDAIWVTMIEPVIAKDDVSFLGRESKKWKNLSTKPKKAVNIKLSFDKTNSKANPVGENRLDTKVSYLMGNESDWKSDINTWGGIRYVDLYPGYDLLISGANGHWNWGFVANNTLESPYPTSLSNINIEANGQNRISIENDQIKLATDVGDFYLPLIQAPAEVGLENTTPEVTGQKIQNPIASTMAASIDDGTMMSASGSSTVYATYFGGGYSESIWDVAADAEGVYITGETHSSDLPVTSGAYDITYNAQSGYHEADVFIGKLSPDLSRLLYLTYLGGIADDVGYGIEVDSAGSAYVTGSTISTNFPTTSGAFDRTCGVSGNCDYDAQAIAMYSDAFVAKINNTGTALVYSSYLGGSKDENENVSSKIAVDSQGNAYVFGDTYSTNFPVTSGVVRSSFAGAWDLYVTKINPTGSAIVYSTYLGGSGVDSPGGISVSNNGEVYVTGFTGSNDFPVTGGSYQTQLHGPYDIFVSKLNTTATQFLYSTFLGGTGDEYPGGISVDSNGFAYVSGYTGSSDFPATNAITAPNGYDIVVAKINQAGNNLVYATRVGGSRTDAAEDIAINQQGEAYVTGFVLSPDFPLTPNAYDRTVSGQQDAVILKLNSSGGGLVYSSFIGGSNSDDAWGVALGSDNTAFIGGRTGANFPFTPGAFQTTLHYAFVAAFNLIPPPISDKSVVSGKRSGKFSAFAGDQRGNQVDSCCDTQGEAGDPINTRTGSFDFNTVGMEIPTLAGPLVLQQFYSSNAINSYTTPLGYGWTHNQDVYLIFPNDPGGEPDTVWFKGHTGNQYKFIKNTDGTYTPFFGVTATLTFDQTANTYRMLVPDQSTYIFNSSGKLVQWINNLNQSFAYSYDANGRLENVTDPSGQRYLHFDYDPQNRISTVSDNASRTVSFIYDASGNLETFTDLSNQVWTYHYDSNHRLTEVIDPQQKNSVKVVYDAQGRANQQYDGQNRLTLSVTYNADGTTIITDGFGHNEQHQYNQQNTLSSAKTSSGSEFKKEYDANFRITRLTDPNGKSSQRVWSASGSNLEKTIDASGGEVDFFHDSWNNLTQVVDERNFSTTFEYNGKLLTGVRDPLTPSNEFTYIYTYTTAADSPQPPDLLKTVRDPLGHITAYTYNLFGQVISITDAANKTTSFTYNALGEIINTHYPTGRIDWRCYDQLDRVIRTVTNASGDGSSPATDPCDQKNYQSSADRNYDLINRTVYDLSGNMIATINNDGLVMRNYYDENNRLVTTVTNLVDQTIENSVPPNYNPVNPNQNIRTDTAYDLNGNVIARIDTLGIISRTYYNSDNRPEYVVQNLTGQAISVGIPPTYDPVYPDRNVRTQTIYDPSGNVIAIIDPNGVINRTYYNATNHPVTVVKNLVGKAVSDSVPPSYDPLYPDRNVRTDTVYDLAGNPIATINPDGVITRTYYDALNRPQTVVENMVGQAIDVETPPTFDPYYPDRNLTTDYVYDRAGNQIAVVDPGGEITRSYYDELNRPAVVVANLTGLTIEQSTPPAYDPAYPDQNVRTETRYDNKGRTIATIDPIGIITRTYYDQNDRKQFIVRNLIGQSIETETPPAFNLQYPDQNVVTGYNYDWQGHQIAIIGNDGKIERIYYDTLGRMVAVVQNLVGQSIDVPNPPIYNPNYPDQNVKSETIYGPGGRVSKTIDPVGKQTYSCYDNLGRVTKTIENPTVSNPCVDYTPSSLLDTDITIVNRYDLAGNRLAMQNPNGKETTYEYDKLYRLTKTTDPLLHPTSSAYDAMGHQVSQTDARGSVTRYEYDAVGRLKAVVGNYQPGQPANQETNVRTEYTYDANGHRITIKDALLHVSTFGYDALGRMVNEKDALNHETTHQYNGCGNHVQTRDANGATTIYRYDGLGRLTLIDYPDPDADIIFTYDASGNRKTMSDGTGLTSWDYDALNRTTAITNPANAVVRYGYNGVGNRISLQYPDLKNVSYGYDSAGRLHSVTGWNASITQYGYDRNGNIKTITLPNEVVTTYTYDDANRLTTLTHQKGAQTIGSYSYGYDEVNNTRSASETLAQAATPSSDLLFTDGFETNNFSAWSRLNGPQAEIRTSAAAALAGGYGMEVVINNNNGKYLTDWSPTNETRYKANYKFDPNTITMTNGDAHYIFIGYNSAGSAVLRIEFRKYSGSYQVRAETVDSSNHWSSSSWYAITDSPHTIEFEWKIATDSKSRDGFISLTIDGTLKQTVTLANYTVRLSYICLGAVSGVDSGTRGSYYFDAFTAYRSKPWVANESVTRTITYDYDALYRLKLASDNDGTNFTYSYDGVGNRMMEVTTGDNQKTYGYDNANRLTSVNGVNYTWDNNGNLLSDGTRSFTYDYANRLKSVTLGTSTTMFAYNGLGDRVQEIQNGQLARFILDLNTNLTQVLSDGSNTYLYGNSRIEQFSATSSAYFLGDTLGSVRQLVDDTSTVILSRDYEPYGSMQNNIGGGVTSYGYTGEWASSTNLLYLRARFYNTSTGRFLTHDTWAGDKYKPFSYNAWLYVYSNPINLTDPTGFYPWDEMESEIEGTFHVDLKYDRTLRSMYGSSISDSDIRDDWYIGTTTEIIQRFREVKEGLSQFADALGGLSNWYRVMQLSSRPLPIYYIAGSSHSGGNATADRLHMFSLNWEDSDDYVIHEMAHSWSFRVFIGGQDLNEHYRKFIGSYYISNKDGSKYSTKCDNTYYFPGPYDQGVFYDPNHPDIGPNSPIIQEGTSNHVEDLAISTTMAIKKKLPINSIRLYWIAFMMPGVKAEYNISDETIRKFFEYKH